MTLQEKTKKGISREAIISFFFIVCFLILVVIHEDIHVAIYKNYGISSIVTLANFPDITTVPTTACPDESCSSAQNMNDIVSYHLTFLLLSLFIWMEFKPYIQFKK